MSYLLLSLPQANEKIRVPLPDGLRISRSPQGVSLVRPTLLPTGVLPLQKLVGRSAAFARVLFVHVIIRLIMIVLFALLLHADFWF